MLRALVVEHLAHPLGLDDSTTAAAMAAALVGEVGTLIAGGQPRGDDAAIIALSATLLDRLEGLSGVARIVRHTPERWDGAGAPYGLREHDIPLGSRTVALARVLVGPVETGGLPVWPARCGRARALAGSLLDPSLVAAAITPMLATAPVTFVPSLDHALAALHKRVYRRTGRAPLDTIVDIGATIRAARRLDEMLVLLAEHTRRALDASVVSVGRIDAATQSLKVVANIGDIDSRTDRFPTEETYALSGFPDESGFGRGTEHQLDRTSTSPRVIRYLEQRGVNSEIAAPINIGGETWGSIWAGKRPPRAAFSGNDLAALQIVAQQFAVAIEHTDRLADFESLALRDPLTGLGNRRVLDMKLRELFRRSALERQDCALIMCDVDELKNVNDTLGHAVGDRVLLDTANALRDAVEHLEGATVCRIGGDEFCVVLERGGLLHAYAVADRVQQLVDETDAARSVSCGVAIADLDVHSASELLRAADVAQYDQKRSRKGLENGRPQGQRRRADRRGG